MGLLTIQLLQLVATTTNVFATPITVQFLMIFHALTVKSPRLPLTPMSAAVAKIPSNASVLNNHHFNLVQIALDQLTPQLLADAQDILNELVFHLISVNSKEKATNQVPSGLQLAIHALLAAVQVLQTWKDSSFQFVTPNVAETAQWVMSELLTPENVAACVFH